MARLEPWTLIATECNEKFLTPFMSWFCIEFSLYIFFDDIIDNFYAFFHILNEIRFLAHVHKFIVSLKMRRG